MKTTNIPWCDATFNPWEGCTKWSPGCVHCYAENRNARFGGGTAPNWGKGAPRRRTSKSNWNQPLKWNATAALEQQFFNEPGTARNAILGPVDRPRVFCASLADVFDEEVPVQWRADLFQLISATPNLDWLLLTKRPENVLPMLFQISNTLNAEATGPQYRKISAWVRKWLDGNPPANVWLGTSVEDQSRANIRIPALLSIPARKRFISAEPLLGPICLAEACGGAAVSVRLDWAILGGESGPRARPCCAEWIWDLVLQCRGAGIAPFVKQLGAQAITSNANAMAWPEETTFTARAAKGSASACVALHDKKGGDPAEWPEELRIREFP